MKKTSLEQLIKQAAAILNEIATEVTCDENTRPLKNISIYIDTETKNLSVDKQYKLS